MSRISDIMEGRNQGLMMAHKIVKEGGLEALTKEINYRNISGISLNLTQKEIQDASWKAHVRATEVAIAISLVTLLDEFCFSRSQLTKFKAAFDANMYDAANSDKSMEILGRYIKRIKDEVGIEVLIGE